MSFEARGEEYELAHGSGIDDPSWLRTMSIREVVVATNRRQGASDRGWPALDQSLQSCS